MKAVRIFISIACLTLVGSALSPQDSVITVKGKNGRPFIGHNNIPGLVYIEAKGGISLYSGKWEKDISLLSHPTEHSGSVFSLSTALDQAGRSWIIWQSGQTGNFPIQLARVANLGLKDKYEVSKNIPGKNLSPGLAFTPDSSPWAVWINIYGKKQRLIVKNLFTENSWILDRSSEFSIFTPLLLVDGAGRLWVFWVGRRSGLDEIFCSFFNGYDWSHPYSLSSDPEVPNFHPSVHTGPDGYPWVVWCGYDKEDYEIFLRKWNGEEWSPKEQITVNTHLSDGEPTLGFFRNTIPVIAWSQINGDNKDILIIYQDHGTWRRTENIPIRPGRNSQPRLFSGSDRLLLSWEHAGNIYFTTFIPGNKNFSDRYEENKIQNIQPPAHLFQNDFITFGDSITYGWKDFVDAKETGYPPRLSTLLPAIFDKPHVHNRGVPAEATWEAVGRIFSVITTDLSLYLLLMEGTNDVSTDSYSLDATAFNLREMVKKCLNFGVIPLISTIIPRARSRWTPSAEERTLSLNKKIRTLASDQKIILTENFQAFYEYPASNGGYESLISTDNLHPNNQGYQFMAETWYNKIKTIPFPPIDIKAKIGAGGEEITITWQDDPRINPATGIANYRIYRKSNETAEFTHIATVAAPSQSYKDTNLSSGKSYVYSISSVNSDGVRGALANPVSPESADPFPPVNIQAKILMREQLIRLSWEKNPQNSSNIKVKNYKIYRKTQSQAVFTLIKTTAAGVFKYDDQSISLNNNYVYAVSTVSSEGFESPKSDPVIPVVGDPYPPVSLSARLYRRDKTIVLSWQNNPKNFGLMNIIYYRIYRKQANENEFKPIKIILYPEKTFSDSGLDPGLDYRYAVSAINSDELEGPLSGPAIPEISDPFPPVNIQVDTLANRAFFYVEYINRVIWSENPSNRNLFTITRYRIYKKQKGQDDELFQLIKEVDASYLIFLDRNLESLQNAQNYEYGIAAVDWNNIEGPIGKQP